MNVWGKAFLNSRVRFRLMVTMVSASEEKWLIASLEKQNLRWIFQMMMINYPSQMRKSTLGSMLFAADIAEINNRIGGLHFTSPNFRRFLPVLFNDLFRQKPAGSPSSWYRISTWGSLNTQKCPTNIDQRNSLVEICRIPFLVWSVCLFRMNIVTQQMQIIHR